MSEVGKKEDGSITWDLRWIIFFFVQEKSLVVKFFYVLIQFQFSEEGHRWFWKHNKDGVFSVASAYLV